MRKLMLLSSMRENSSRCPHKMTMSLGNTNLALLTFKRFEEIGENNHSFHKIGIAVNKNDKLLWDYSKKFDVNIIKRDDNSVSKGNLKTSEVFNYLKNVDSEYIMWVNASFPFLKPDTIIKAATIFLSNNVIKSMTCVKKRFTWFWEPVTKKPINNKNPLCVNTQYSYPLLENVHCFHIFNRKHMLKTNSFWNLKENDPYLYEVEDSVEFLDIDSELDFKVCKSIK